MKAIVKKLIEAIRHIDGRRLAKATGLVLGTALIITTIIVLGRYAPGVLLAIVLIFGIVGAYRLMGE